MITAPYIEFDTNTDGVRLYGRRYGSDEPILMIHGACTDSDFFSETAAVLARRYTVVTYDRRGCGRSSDAPPEQGAVQAQAEDAAAVLHAVGASAFVVGHSAGTTIAMELTAAHPELVRGALLHEPVASNCLPPDDPRARELEKIRGFARVGRFGRAINHFLPLIGEKDKRGRALTPGEEERLTRNAMAFMRDEFEAVFSYEPPYEKLRGLNLTVGVGELSRGSHRWIVAHTLAERIGCPVRYFPGAHNCAFDLPREFAYLAEGLFQEWEDPQ